MKLILWAAGTGTAGSMLLLASLLQVEALIVPRQATLHPAFPSTTLSLSSSASSSSSSSALFGKSRKARRTQKVEKQTRGRSQQFYDAIEDAQGKAKEKQSTATLDSPPDDDDDKDGTSSRSNNIPNDDNDDINQERRIAMMEDAQQRMEARPEVSTTMVDDETGIEVIQQGQNVLDVVTRKAVKLSDLGPEYRLAQMFPGVPPDIRAKYRFESFKDVPVPEIIDRLKDACYITLEETNPDGTKKRGLPPMPSVTNRAIDFVLANRDLLGRGMDRTLGRLTMRAAWQGNEEETQEARALWRHFTLLENHISAPFRQILQDAEGRMGPNFGNLDLMSFCDGELYERIANYIVLKGMVAHWEKKVVDADFIEKTPHTKENYISVLSRGDPKRFLPNPPILFTLKECTQVCAMAQTMCKQFVETEALSKDFPPEIVFLEEALQIRGGTALRKYMIDEFCPARGITPDGLREGMRRFYQQLDNMQTDPYGDLTTKVQELFQAMAVGTDDAKLLDPYEPYLGMKASTDPNSPGYFQSYTFNHPKQSIVRFLDNRYPSASGVSLISFNNDNESSSNNDNPFDFLGKLFGTGERNLRSEPKSEVETTYKVPEERSAGRPHEQGWLEKLNEPPKQKVRLGEMRPGRIIPDEACD